MAYIGKTPTVGNFQVCDAISVVNNQAAYTMQVGSVNVSPESANHMIVSLNGVIQKPTDAFTVSGSTITFASNLVTGDVINFIQILGNVLDLGVPSDSTVSIAKLTATGTKNSTTFLRGDNTFNAPPNTGITVADNWRLNADDATDAAETDLDTGWERVDTTGQGTLGSAMTQSSGVFTFPSTGIYLVQFQIYYIMSGGNGYGRAWIKHKNSSTYTTLVSLQNYQIQNESMALCVSTLFDCQNTTNDTVVFYGGSGTNGQVIAGSTSESRTAATFIRLGDT